MSIRPEATPSGSPDSEGFIERVTRNDRHPFTCHIPEKNGWISNLAMKILFRNVKTGEPLTQKVTAIPENAHVVYLNRDYSTLELLFAHHRYRQIGIPAPAFGFDYQIRFMQPFRRVLRTFGVHALNFLFRFRFLDPYTRGYYRENLENGLSGFLSLDSEGSFERRFVKSETDPIEYLIELQQKIERPIYLVPQILFFGNNPHRENPSMIDVVFGSEEKPGKLRRIYTLLKNRKKPPFLEFAAPINLKERLLARDMQALDSDATRAFQLRHELTASFNRHRQSVTGPVIKARAELIEDILTSEKVQTLIAEQAEETRKSIQATRKKANGFLDEIAANLSMKWIKIFDVALTWMLNHIFDGISVDQEGLSRVRELSKDAPLILVPCHKSHLDYLILSYLFHYNKMPVPHIAAGKNLSFWPMGNVLRGGGAFFLRRTFKGQKLYAKIFSAYVEKLLTEGFNIEFFIEGGRSRTGKLLAPKMGLMSQVLTAYRNGACPDLVVCPIYIGYDRVLEEKSYLHELGGGKKEPENMGQLLKARKSLKVRYGKVYVNFHEPISVKKYLAGHGIDPVEMDRKTHQAVCNDIGFRCIDAINKVGVVTPYGIVASALLNIPQTSIDQSRLNEVMDTYMKYLGSTGARLADTLQVNPAYALKKVVETFISRGFVEKTQSEEEDDIRLVMAENKRPIVDYYKNNSINFMIPAAYTALAILKHEAFQFSSDDLHLSYKEISDFFQDEFFRDPDMDAETQIRENLKAFIHDAILVPHRSLPDTYNLTAAGFRKLKLFANFMLTYFESYWVTLNFFMRYPEGSVDIKDRPKKIHAMGSRMNKRGEIYRPEALSRINYKNAAHHFDRIGVKGSEDKETIAAQGDFIQKYIELILN